MEGLQLPDQAVAEVALPEQARFPRSLCLPQQLLCQADEHVLLQGAWASKPNAAGDALT